MVPHRVKRKWVLDIDYINGKDSVSLLEKRNPFSCAPIYGFEIASIKGPWNISIRKMYAIPPRKDGPQAGQRPFIMPFRLVCEFLYVKGEFQRNSPARKPDNKQFLCLFGLWALTIPKNVNAVHRTDICARAAAYTFFRIYGGQEIVHMDGVVLTRLGTPHAGDTAHLAGIHDCFSFFF